MEVLQRYSKTPVPLLRRPRRTSEACPDKRKHRIHAARRRLTDEQTTALIAEYEAGAPSTVLMERYEIGKGTVLGILQRNGVELRRPRVYTREMLTETIRLYAQGLSCQRIGDRLGRDAQTVRHQLQRAGVQLRPGHGGPPRRERSLTQEL